MPQWIYLALRRLPTYASRFVLRTSSQYLADPLPSNRPGRYSRCSFSPKPVKNPKKKPFGIASICAAFSRPTLLGTNTNIASKSGVTSSTGKQGRRFFQPTKTPVHGRGSCLNGQAVIKWPDESTYGLFRECRSTRSRNHRADGLFSHDFTVRDSHPTLNCPEVHPLHFNALTSALNNPSTASANAKPLAVSIASHIRPPAPIPPAAKQGLDFGGGHRIYIPAESVIRRTNALARCFNIPSNDY
jgi:hypothetical protein